MHIRGFGLASVAAIGIVCPAQAQQQQRFNIPSQDLAAALEAFGQQGAKEIIFDRGRMRGKVSGALQGEYAAAAALERILAGSGFSFRQVNESTFVVDSGQAAAPTAERNTSTGNSESFTALEEIVVTANKREERLADVGASLSVLTQGGLERLQAVRFEDYLTRLPAVSLISGRQGETQVIMRGITSGANQNNASVGIYIDETPFGSSTVFASGNTLTPDLDTFDMQRIEVVRGPQGTLYGASTLGGLLKFVTAPPDASAISSRVALDASSIDGGGVGYGVKAMLNLPLITDKLALRANVYRREDAGFIDDTQRLADEVNDTEVTGGRASMLLRATDNLSVRLNFLFQQLRGGSTSSIDVDPVSLQPLYGDLEQRRVLEQFIDIDYRLYNTTVEWNLGFARLTSATSYSTLDRNSLSDATLGYRPRLGFDVGIDSVVEQTKLTQEVRLASQNEQPLQWQVGGFFTREDGETRQNIQGYGPSGAPLTGLPTIFRTEFGARFKEYAGFGNITYFFAPTFDVTVGGRWSPNEQDFHQSALGLLNNPTNPSLASAFGRPSSEETSTYLISPRWRPADDVLLYARVAKGYRPGGPNVVPPSAAGVVPLTFEPDTLMSYELGAKTGWLDRRLNIDVSAFYIDWTKVQLTVARGGFAFLGNGGAAESQGLEWTVSYRPLGGLTIGVNGAYTDATLTADAPGVGGRTGDRLPYVAQWSGALDADYEWNIPGSTSVSLGASYRYVGDRESSYGADVRRVNLPSYEVVDLRAGVHKGNYGLALYVKNLTDERGLLAAAGLTLVPGGSPYSASIIQPRTFGLSVTAGF